MEVSVRKYQDDSDFDEAFKNLLRPIESIIKKKQCEPLQYDLIKVIVNLYTTNIIFHILKVFVMCIFCRIWIHF